MQQEQREMKPLGLVYITELCLARIRPLFRRSSPQCVLITPVQQDKEDDDELDMGLVARKCVCAPAVSLTLTHTNTHTSRNRFTAWEVLLELVIGSILPDDQMVLLYQLQFLI